MLGEIAAEHDARGAERRAPRSARTDARRGSSARGLSHGTKLTDARSTSTRARCSASSRSRARARTSCSTSWPARDAERRRAARRRQAGLFRHPADAIRAGLVYVAGRSRRGAADAALRAREHRPAVLGPDRHWGSINLGRERTQGRRGASSTLQIDARAGGEVRRLSGGNQQKVTIARWVAGGVQTMLCFDPTRGIDIRTKQPDLRAAARPGRGRRRRPPVHVGAQGDPARLRPRDRHLRRPGRRRDRRPRDADEAALLRAALQPQAGRRRCPRRSLRRRRGDAAAEAGDRARRPSRTRGRR